jgi:hypothetical protein
MSNGVFQTSSHTFLIEEKGPQAPYDPEHTPVFKTLIQSHTQAHATGVYCYLN